jgi:hypothetical protein
MFGKISEIAKAWIISLNPSPIQTELAKKIFSEKFDACPKHYWLEVEKPYYKTEKTIL